jgi:hypothetical protein
MKKKVKSELMEERFTFFSSLLPVRSVDDVKVQQAIPLNTPSSSPFYYRKPC